MNTHRTRTSKLNNLFRFILIAFIVMSSLLVQIKQSFSASANTTYKTFPWVDCTLNNPYSMNGYGYSSSAIEPNVYYVKDGNANIGGATFSLAHEQTCAYSNNPLRIVVDFSRFAGSIVITSGTVKRYNPPNDVWSNPGTTTLGNVIISANGQWAWFDVPISNMYSTNTHYTMQLTLKMVMPSMMNSCDENVLSTSGNVNVRMRRGSTLNDPVVYSRDIWSTVICY